MKTRFLNHGLNGVLLLLGVVPLMLLIVDSFSCRVSPAFPLWLVLLCLLLWLGSVRKGLLPLSLLLCFFLLAATARLYSEDLIAELSDLFEQISTVYFEYFYGTSAARSPGTQLPHTAILLIFAFLLSGYLIMALTSAHGRIALSLIGVLPVLAACIAINGFPRVGQIFGFLLFLILLFVSSSRFVPESNRGLASALVAIPAALLLSLLLLIHSPARYNFDEEDIALSRRFDRFSAALSSWYEEKRPAIPELLQLSSDRVITPSLPHLEGGNWGVREGALDLTEGRGHVDEDKLILRAKADASGYLYLRRLSYGDYTGTGWLPAGDSPGDSSLPFTASALAGRSDAEAHRVTVRFAVRSELLCVPYYSVLDLSDDRYLPSNGDRDYQAEYWSFGGDMSSLRLEGALAESEIAYRAYAHETYTRLPERTRAGALALLRENGISADTPELVSRIADYVQGAGRYDLSTPPYEDTEDYALYFLTQAKQGYCVHFATAAAVLYRAMNIPARVTDGFLFYAKAGEPVDVLQGDEHAWVEVYQDGLGWMAVEVTGSSGFFPDLEAAATHAPAEPSAEASIPPAQVPIQTPAPAAPSPTPRLPVGQVRNQPSAAQTPETGGAPALPNALPLLLAALLAGVAIPFLIQLRREKLRRSFRQKDSRKAAIAIWRQAEHLSRCGAETPDEIRSAAEKASFSRNEPSREELRAAREALHQMTKRLWPKLKPFQKFLLRCLWGVK